MGFRKISAIAIFIAFSVGAYGVYYLFTPSTQKLIKEMNKQGLAIRVLQNDEAAEKKRFLNTHGSGLLLTIFKSLASTELEPLVYQRTIASVGKLSAGLIVEVNGVTVEITKFRWPYLARAAAEMQNSLLQKDETSEKCKPPESSGSNSSSNSSSSLTSNPNSSLASASCSKVYNLATRNFLFVVSDVKNLIEVKDAKGHVVAVDYAPVPKETLDHVVNSLSKL